LPHVLPGAVAGPLPVATESSQIGGNRIFRRAALRLDTLMGFRAVLFETSGGHAAFIDGVHFYARLARSPSRAMVAGAPANGQHRASLVTAMR
jgi:hypothetical protein